MNRLKELDALRGIAALMVVVFHFTTRYDALYGHTSAVMGFPWAWHGVNLFFGLSGFVIYLTLDRTRKASDFVVSRFSRLFPAYWAAIVLTTLVVQMGMPDLQHSAREIAVNFTMLQEFVLVPSVDGVYWTLEVELAFYAVMLALYLAGGLKRIEVLLLPWIGLKWIWWWHSVSYTLGALVIQEFVPYFAIGIMCYRLWSRQTRPVIAWAYVLLAIVTLAVTEGTEAGITGALVGAVFLLFAYGRLTFLRGPVLGWLGGISYTLYLLHENIGWTLIHALEQHGVTAYAAIAITLLIVLGLASAVTYGIERPAMRAIRNAYRTERGSTVAA